MEKSVFFRLFEAFKILFHVTEILFITGYELAIPNATFSETFLVSSSLKAPYVGRVLNKR